MAADALVLKVREGGRVVYVHALLATGVAMVTSDAHRGLVDAIGATPETFGLGVSWMPPQARGSHNSDAARIDASRRKEPSMTSEPVRDPVTDPLLTPSNSALLVVDYQIQTVRSVDTIRNSPR